MKKIKKIQLEKLITVIIMFIVALNIIFNKNQKLQTTIDAELARMMTYEQFEDDDFKTYNDYVSFGAFFLRDLDGDGYAEKIAGTSKEIGKTDTLYMNLNVSTQGYIKDGIIKIVGNNFKLQTAIVKDSVVKNNAIGLDTTEIQLNDVYPGTTKLLMGIVNTKIQSTADYSQINQIIFTATYVDENLNEIPIEKTIDLTVDWYGDVNTQITTNTETIYANECMDEENGTIDLKFKVTTQETKKQLILTENNVKLTIPELNGYKPTNAVLEGSNGTVTYNEETGEFEIIRTSTDLPTTNTYTIIVTYPIEAYTTLGEETTSVLIPVESYHIGANNPNEEFENPQISETATKTITLVIEKEKQEVSQDPKVSVTIGKYVATPNARYVISKKLPMKRYAGEEIEENTEYTVQWKTETGTEALKGIKLEQTSEDKIYDNSTSTEISMAELTKYTGIYIVSAEAVVGQDGYINVINSETDEVIHTFTSSDWSTYTASNPYKYETPLENIRIETSSTLPGTTLMIYNIKEIDDEILTKTYDEEQFANLSKINTYLTGTIVKETDTVLNATNTADYEEEASRVSIALSKTEISTQEEEKNELITIATQTQEYNTAKWINGQFVVKFPPDIALVEINEIKISDATVKILGHEIYQKDGNYFIKIVTENETETSYQITIDCNLHADPRISTTSYEVELYAVNENWEKYQTGNSAEDIYDVNSNNDTTEIVAYSSTTLKLVAPGSLTTSQVATEYDDFGSTTLAPQIAEITPEAIINSSGQNPKIAVQIRNNYTGTVSETLILGKIPFKGNTDGITGNDLGSTYTTIMKSEGLTIPENLQDEVTIYYSTNENPTTDLNDTSNGWTTTPADWSQVKTYLIDFEDYVLSSKEECVFIYEIEIPDDVNYNEVSYSTHKVEFYLDTENGKLYQEIEPRKLGFRIAKKYDLELTKYKKGTTETLQGITFKLIELDENGEEAESRIRTTDENGLLDIEGLYVEKTYILKEIKTLSEYDLNKEEIKFVATINENGELVVTVLEGAFKNNKIDITQATEAGENPVVHVAVENEVKYNLVINKTDAQTGEALKGARFELKNGKTRKLTTNSNGQINVKGISIGQENILTETEAEGYYLLEPIKFIIIRNDDNTLSLTLTHENGENVTYNLEETVEGTVCPRLTLNIKNTPIPKYSMNILKVSKQTNIQTGTTTTDSTVKKLEGAQFELYSKDLDTTEIYTTNENGNISLDGLYEYVEGKEVTGEYTLKEIYAPAGHALNESQLEFRTQRNTDGNLTLVILSGQNLIADTTDSITGVVYDSTGTEITTKNVTIENPETDSPTIGITVENESIFSIEKRDKDTGELLEGAKFTIYEIDENYEIIGNAKDVEGNILGTLETIDGQEYYTLTTNQYGQITAQIGEGYYKAVEVAVPEGYILDADESNRTYLFGIGKSKPAERIAEETWNKADFNGVENNLTYEDIVTTSDGGHVIVGDFYNTVIIDGEKTVDGNAITLTTNGDNGYPDEIVIKYNSEGKIEWANRSGSTASEYTTSVIENSNNEIVTLGRENNDKIDKIIINKFDLSTGELIEENITIQTSVNSGSTLEQIIQTSDNGYIVVGKYNSLLIPEDVTNNLGEISKTSTATTEGFIIKINSEGLVEWCNTIGGTTGNNIINSVVELPTGEFLAVGKVTAGTCEINGESVEFAAGAVTVTISAEGLLEEVVSVITTKVVEFNKIITTDDGYAIAGHNGYRETITLNGTETILNAGIFVLKYNLVNELQWIYQSGTGYYSGVRDLEETADGGFVFVGERLITITNGLIRKIDSNGIYEWENTVSSEDIGEFKSVEIKDDNKIVTVGDWNGYIQEIEQIGAVYIEYDINGNVINANSIYPETQTYNGGCTTDDGGSIAVGTFEGILEIDSELTSTGDDIKLASMGNEDGLIVKYNSDGLIEWAKKLGGGTEEVFNEIIKVEDGYIVAGYFVAKTKLRSPKSFTIPAEDTKNGEEIKLTSKGLSDCLLVKYTEDGLVEWAKQIGGTSENVIRAVTKTYDNGYTVVGNFYGTITIPAEDTVNGSDITLTSLGSYDGMVIKYNESNLIEWAISIGGTAVENIYTIDEENGQYLLSLYSKGTVSLTTENNEILEITCSSYGDDILINLNEYGEILWAFKIINNHTNIRVTGVSIKDDEYLVTGSTLNGKVTIEAENTVSQEAMQTEYSTQWSGYILKVNSKGKAKSIQTVATGGGGYNGESGILDIKATNDGGYIVNGTTGSSQLVISAEEMQDRIERTFDGTNLAFVYKYNNDGLIEWVQANNTSSSYNSISEGEDGAYFAAGYTLKNSVNTGLITKITETTLAAEVPPTQKINAKNEKIKYTITGKVEGEGGTITIGANKGAETVRYNENSVENIVITPETGYQIKTIEINEQNYEFEPEEDGTVTLAKFENVLQNKNIVVTFLKTSLASDVVVHHYLWENGSGTTTPVIADELITGETGEQYTALPKLNLAKYELITNSDYYGENIPEGLLAEDYYIPENSVGTIAEGIEVTYYYKLKTYTLTIHHYLDGTKTSLVPDTIKTGLEIDTTYATSVEKTDDLKYNLGITINGTEESEGLEIDAQRYKILSIDGEETGTITSNIEITYYYTDTAFNLTVEKVWEDNENIANTRPEQITIELLKNGEKLQEYTLDIVNGESSYTFTELYKYDENEKEIIYTAQEASIPEGYYVSSTTKQNNKIIITNSKLGSITINKVDKKTSEPLQGAEFKIEKQQGEDWLEIQTITTDENGQAKIEELQYGIYIITETKAPEGYNLNKKSQEIEISSSNIDSKITITNREKTILPEAGGDGAYLIIAIELITIVGGILIKNNKRKHKNKH